MVGVDDRAIRVGERLGEFGDERESLVDDLGAECHEPFVPDVERGQPVGGQSAGAGALEQRVALLEHPLVVGHDPRESRGALHEQFVEQSPPNPGLAPHDGQVFGCEEHAVRIARQLTALHRRPVELGAVGPVPIELEFDEQFAVAVGEERPDDRGVGAGPDERLVARDAMRAERREVADGLDEVGLALAVATDEHRRPRPEFELGARVVAVVGEREARDVHGRPSFSRTPTTLPATADSRHGTSDRRIAESNAASRYALARRCAGDGPVRQRNSRFGCSR